MITKIIPEAIWRRTSIRSTVAVSFLRFDQLKKTSYTPEAQSMVEKKYQENLTMGVTDNRFHDTVSC